MRVIAEANIHMTEKDEITGLHHIKDRYCDKPGPCFSFDCNGRKDDACEYFNKLVTGVKICKKPRR